MNNWKILDKSNVIYIGDAPSDITACREVGIPVVPAAWAPTAEPELLKTMEPDAIFSNIQDFKRWFVESIAV